MILDYFICSSCFLIVCFQFLWFVGIAIIHFTFPYVIINNHLIHCYYYCFEKRDLLDRLRVRKKILFYFYSLLLWLTSFFMLILTCPFLSAWVTAFSISCRSGMLVKTSFYFSGKVFMFPLLLKDNFLDIGF